MTFNVSAGSARWEVLYSDGALVALKNWASQTIFYHYDGWPEDPLDEHSGHPLLCSDAAVLTDLRFYGDTALKFLEELDLISSEVISIDTRTRFSALEFDQELNSSCHPRMLQRPRLSFFYPSREDLSEGQTLVLTPEVNLFELWNNKQTTHSCLENMGVEAPLGVCVRSYLEATAFIKQTSGPWILKSDVSRPRLVHDICELDGLENLENGRWIIEQVIKTPLDAPSPNLTWLIPRDESESPIFLFAADQRINTKDFSHEGNRFPTTITSELLRRCQLAAEPVLHALRGIDSVVGIDFIFDTDWQPMVVDINPRFNSCTFPGLAFDVLCGGNDRIGIYATVHNAGYQNLSSFYEEFDNTVKWFSNHDGKGLILFSPQGISEMTAFRILCIGEDDLECEGLYSDFVNVTNLQARN